jgi:hypothetical protein
MGAILRSVVYFASGTGNSYLVAAWFRDACAASCPARALVMKGRKKPRPY